MPVLLTGGAEGNRTPDLLNAIQTLSQLSYNPIITLFLVERLFKRFLPRFQLASVTRFLNSPNFALARLFIKKTSPLTVINVHRTFIILTPN